jgi:STE24 endopeptidase
MVVTTDAVTSPLTPPECTGHYGAWRALAAAPAMAGSLLLLLVLFGWLGQWEALVLLAWLASAAAVFTRVGERIAVRVGCGFRRPTWTQKVLLEPVWTDALRRCGLNADEVDLYVQPSSAANAFAAGGRSIAVTRAAVESFRARRLGEEYLLAVLVHELGHHQTRATRFALVTVWLAAPWRCAARLILGLSFAIAGRIQPLRLAAAVATAAVVVAIVQAIQAQQWAVVVVLSSVAGASVICPLADAVVSRRSEYAADCYTAQRGLGPQLAAALQTLTRSPRRPLGWTARLLSRHPELDRRLEWLAQGATAPAAQSEVARHQGANSH